MKSSYTEEEAAFKKTTKKLPPKPKLPAAGWPSVSMTSKQQNNSRQEADDRQKGRQARKRPSTTVYFCSRLIAPQAAGCWRCLSGPSPTWGYLVEVVRAPRAGRWPPPSGRCWRTPATAAGSPRGWTPCRPWPNRC